MSIGNSEKTTSRSRWAHLASVVRSEGVPAVSRKLLRFAYSRVSKYKAQKGQDRWVLESLDHKRRGYFVDLAASDGITHSNTWVLEKSWDWDGIVVEPNPRFYQRLVARRGVTAYQCAVDERPGTVPFRVDNGGLGGIVADDTDNCPSVRGDQLQHAEILDIPARTLTDLLDEAGAPSEIDYLSLDVEGAEDRVLRGLDFDRYTFYCMTVERPSESAHELLQLHGYQFVKTDMFDAFYVHESHPFFESIAIGSFEAIPRKSR